MHIRISRASQDIVAKYLTSACAGDVLQVLGIPHAAVVRALPTEVPRVAIRQSLTDIVLETSTGEILHLEFQSTREPSLYRFLAYDVALAEKFRRPIRTLVLYSQPIAQPPATLAIGCATYHVENISLAEVDGEAALAIVATHLAAHRWTPADRVRLAFAFHMRFSTVSTDEAFRRILELTRQVDREEQNYLAALILGFSGRQLSPEQTAEVLEVLEMTELLRTVERNALKKGREQGREEGRQEGRQEGREEGREEGRQEGREEGRQEGREEGRQQTALSVALALLRKGLPLEEVAALTQLPLAEVRVLAQALSAQ